MTGNTQLIREQRYQIYALMKAGFNQTTGQTHLNSEQICSF